MQIRLTPVTAQDDFYNIILNENFIWTYDAKDKSMQVAERAHITLEEWEEILKQAKDLTK